MSDEEIIEYTDHPEFNEWLDNDSENNIVTVAGYAFSPSETLYKMNYEQYAEAYKAYLDDDYVLLDDVYYNFPTPISFYLYQAQENYDNPHQRLDLLKSAWESLVFISYALVVGEARHRKIPLKEIGVDLSEFYSDRLAKRLTIVENILDLCTKKNYPLSCLSILSVDTIAKLRALNGKRNEFEHSLAATSERQQDLYNALFPEMMTAFKLSRNLNQVSLFRYHSNGDGGILLPRCDVFRGHSLDGAKKTIQLTKNDLDVVIPYFNPQVIFAHIEGENVFCLSPFVHFKKDAQEMHPRLIVYKKKVSGGKYQFGIVGQSASIDFVKDLFKDRDNELRNLVLGGGE